MKIGLMSAAASALLVPSLAFAQAPVHLCMPEASTETREALTVELRARGHDVAAECPGAPSAGSWTLSLEVPDPLADVWVHATGPSGERRARVGGPLDTLDARAIALTAASLLDEVPIPPPPAGETDLPEPSEAEPATASAVSPQAQLTAPSESEPPRTNTPERPVELVESTRMLRPTLMIELGIIGGLVTHELWTIGGRAGIGIHLAPWLRLRVPIAFSYSTGQTYELSSGIGLDAVVSLSRGESWLELGLAARLGTHNEGVRLSFDVGPGANIGYFHALSESWRIFVRAEGMALFDVTASSAPGYGLYLSVGAAVFL